MARTPEERVATVDNLLAWDTDAELGAMYAIVAALTPLDDAARGRVLGWALDRFQEDA